MVYLPIPATNRIRYRCLKSAGNTCFVERYKSVGLSSMKHEPKSGPDVRQNTGLIMKTDNKKIISMPNKKTELKQMINLT